MKPSELLREAARRSVEHSRRRRRAAEALYGRPHAAAPERDVRNALDSPLRTCPPSPGLRSPRADGAWILENHSDVARRVVDEADQVLEGWLRPFTGESLKFSEPIAWRTDWVSGREWRLEHFTSLVTFHWDDSDIRRVWELNRLQHAVALGRAWAVSGDERYPEAFARHLSSWREANPVEMGPNWSNAMEAGIRIANLIVAFHLMSESSAIAQSREFLVRTAIEHGRFIADNLEITHRVTSNHYLCDLAGLLFIGLGLPDIPSSSEWVGFAWPRFLAEVRKQVHPDGVDYEASTAYHRFVLEIVLSVLLLARESGHRVPSDVWRRLEGMCVAHRAMLRPDGTMPLIGDTDDGRFIVWGERPAVDGEYLLTVAAMCFDNELFAGGPPSDEAVWLFGRDGIERYRGMEASSSPRESQVFPDGGIVSMSGGGTFLLVDVGGHGIGGRGSHDHNDTLSFDLFMSGRTVLTDPGTYVYTADPVWRDRFRQTRWHNTIEIDGEEISPFPPGAIFALGADPSPRILSWTTDERLDVLVADHRGYARLRCPVTHQRTLRLDRTSGVLAIDDELSGTAYHAFTFSLTLDDRCRARLDGSATAIDPSTVAETEISEATRCVTIEDAVTGQPLATIRVDCDASSAFAVEERFVSRAYGQKHLSTGLTWSGHALFPLRFHTVITPIAAARGVAP